MVLMELRIVKWCRHKNLNLNLRWIKLKFARSIIIIKSPYDLKKISDSEPKYSK